MLSRVAESIYWMSRYCERAENVARYIDVTLNLTLDLGLETAQQWAPLVYTTGDHDEFKTRFGEEGTRQNVIRFLTFDEDNRNSILSCLRSARENARTVREVISSQMWEELNKFYLLVRTAREEEVLDSPFEFFERIKLAGSLLEGLAESTMSRGEAWHFRRLGRLFERADKTSRILDVKYYLLLPSLADVGNPLDSNQWAALLRSASALDMYRKAYGRITPANVAEFLILDRYFPRSMQFCLMRAEQSLLAITGGVQGSYLNKAEQRLGRLRAELNYANIQEIINTGLHEFIDSFQTKMNDVGEAIAETFFAAPPVHAELHQTALAGASGSMAQHMSS
jgi:uncharacterized alpha-E superfamily protein